MNTITNKGIEYKDRKAVVYIKKTAIDTIINKWFSDNEIYSLDFKCKTWTWLTARRNALIASKIHSLLGLDENQMVKFSQYAGCSCPCSPGFLIKRGNKNERRIMVDGQAYSSIWVNIDTDEYVNDFEDYCKQASLKLEKELQNRVVDKLDSSKIAAK